MNLSVGQEIGRKPKSIRVGALWNSKKPGLVTDGSTTEGVSLIMYERWDGRDYSGWFSVTVETFTGWMDDAKKREEAALKERRGW